MWTHEIIEATPEKKHVEIRRMQGPNRDAVVELTTGEPIQWVDDPSAGPGLVARWQAALSNAIAKARSR